MHRPRDAPLVRTGKFSDRAVFLQLFAVDNPALGTGLDDAEKRKTHSKTSANAVEAHSHSIVLGGFELTS